MSYFMAKPVAHTQCEILYAANGIMLQLQAIMAWGQRVFLGFLCLFLGHLQGHEVKSHIIGKMRWLTVSPPWMHFTLYSDQLIMRMGTTLKTWSITASFIATSKYLTSWKAEIRNKGWSFNTLFPFWYMVRLSERKYIVSNSPCYFRN